MTKLSMRRDAHSGEVDAVRVRVCCLDGPTLVAWMYWHVHDGNGIAAPFWLCGGSVPCIRGQAQLALTARGLIPGLRSVPGVRVTQARKVPQ